MGEAQRGICSEYVSYLYAHFWENCRHKGLDDVCVQVIDVTNIRDRRTLTYI